MKNSVTLYCVDGIGNLYQVAQTLQDTTSFLIVDNNNGEFIKKDSVRLISKKKYWKKWKEKEIKNLVDNLKEDENEKSITGNWFTNLIGGI